LMGDCWQCGRDNGVEHPRDHSPCQRCIDRWCREVEEIARGEDPGQMEVVAYSPSGGP